eukprot:TRINITY_DN5279_c0_g1_i3.p1 TRINITY_DN5279_c0_g1~~TRINITY_DN5279_c0_g1_i3.p1  ORF type:complete len:119 (+),score=14.09 TRINITY_DN5279_c0_g1_i3:1-357(+)
MPKRKILATFTNAVAQKATCKHVKPMLSHGCPNDDILAVVAGLDSVIDFTTWTAAEFEKITAASRKACFHPDCIEADQVMCLALTIPVRKHFGVAKPWEGAFPDRRIDFSQPRTISMQ